jgi:hypothetical protein
MAKLKATHQGILHIANIDIPAFVLEDGRRLISQGGVQRGIGMSRGGGTQGERRILALMTILEKKGLNLAKLKAQIESPVIFYPSRGRSAFGYEASILADLCEMLLDARDRGLLFGRQKNYAAFSEIMIRALAKVGIIALVDEATGYQEIRDKLALQKILEKYLLQEYAKWAKRFPDEFYFEMFRLKGWQWKGMSVNRPSVVGRYTNDIVYERLAPGVLTELKKLNPKDEKGNRKVKHQQFLTPDTGLPALDKHLHSVMALMRASSSWGQFERMLARSFPKLGQTMLLNFDED